MELTNENRELEFTCIYPLKQSHLECMTKYSSVSAQLFLDAVVCLFWNFDDKIDNSFHFPLYQIIPFRGKNK